MPELPDDGLPVGGPLVYSLDCGLPAGAPTSAVTHPERAPVTPW